MDILIKSVSDTALRVEPKVHTGEVICDAVRFLCADLNDLRDFGVLDCTPGYRAATVHYDPARITGTVLAAVVRRRARGLAAAQEEESPIVDIPVCYGGEFGPDLQDVAEAHGIAAEDVVAAHMAPVYDVAFIGFLPGFPYLSGLPESLATPRLSSPRLHVPAGSVGIGGSQTGIYPVDSPAGWRIIGRTPRRLFDLGRPTPSLLKAGDRVRFLPISEHEFRELSGEV